MTKMLETTIPFGGFYESLWSNILDDQESQYIDWQTDEQNEDGEYMWQESYRIDRTTYQGIFCSVSNYKKFRENISASYVEAFRLYMKDEFCIDLPSLKFNALISPREYNFETDRIFASISLDDTMSMFNISRADSHSSLSNVIKERFIHRSGFISSYSNNISEWIEKPISEWDHNEVSTLILAVIHLNGKTQSDVEIDIYNDIPDSGYAEWEGCVDWPKFDELVAIERSKLGYIEPINGAKNAQS